MQLLCVLQAESAQLCLFSEGAAPAMTDAQGAMMKITILGNQSRAMVNFWSVLMGAMRERGHEVLCLVPEGDAQGDAVLRAQGLRVRTYPLDRKGLNLLRDMCTALALWRLFREERPASLFAFTIKPVIYGCMAARLAGVQNIFATITGLGYTFEGDRFFKKCLHRCAVLLYRWALAGARAVFFQNEDDRRVFADTGILRPGMRVVMCRGTGVDTAHFAAVPPVEHPPTFLLVGRLLEAKGLPEYAEAARLLKPRYPEARFQVLGPPEQGLGCVPLERIRSWHDAGDIEYLGETRDVRPFIAAASVMVLPSWREGTPCSIMEGMSMGRAAVVTDAPGCREVVMEGVNGFRVPLRDAPALAAAMERFLRDPVLITRMGREGRRLAEETFDARIVAEHILRGMNL